MKTTTSRRRRKKNVWFEWDQWIRRISGHSNASQKKLSGMTDTKRKRGKQTHDFWPQKYIYIYVYYGTCINNNERTKKAAAATTTTTIHIDVQNLLDSQPLFVLYTQRTIFVEIQENTFAFFFLPLSLLLVSFLRYFVLNVCARYVAIYLTLDFNNNMIWSFTDDIYENETYIALNFVEISPQKLR